jgi:hypothetical protein
MRGDTWTRVLRTATRWICQCGQINPEITSKCLRCG